ncbi:unnamed protein product, partial [Rotaria magnacalcarata]
KHESNNIGSLQASPSMFQFDKSSLILPYLTANGATRIPFFDETQQNTPNEDRKSQQANSISYFPEISLNDSDLVITLYQDKSSMVCTPMNELLTVPELDRISVRSKSELYYDIFHKTFMGSSLYVLFNMYIGSKFEKKLLCQLASGTGRLIINWKLIRDCPGLIYHRETIVSRVIVIAPRFFLHYIAVVAFHRLVLKQLHITDNVKQ